MKWKERLKELNELIYPAISDRIKSIRAKAATAFKNRNLIINNPYPVGSIVYAYNNTRQQKFIE